MKNLEIELLEKIVELNTNRKSSTRIPDMEVNNTMKQSKDNDWISASESLLV